MGGACAFYHKGYLRSVSESLPADALADTRRRFTSGQADAQVRPMLSYIPLHMAQRRSSAFTARPISRRRRRRTLTPPHDVGLGAAMALIAMRAGFGMRRASNAADCRWPHVSPPHGVGTARPIASRAGTARRMRASALRHTGWSHGEDIFGRPLLARRRARKSLDCREMLGDVGAWS